MSKQDGFAPRTPADLQRQYRFGRTFTNLDKEVDEAQKSADRANKSLSDLDQKRVFNLLTNDGAMQGLFMGEDENMYFNASYIKGGTVKAEYLDGDNLKVKAANIDGEVTAKQINAEGLKVDGANVTGTINGAKFVSNGTEEWQKTTIEGGKVSFQSGSMYDGQSGVVYFDAQKLRFDAGEVDFILQVDENDPANTRILRVTPEYGLVTVDGNDDLKQNVVFSKTFNELKARVEAIEAKLGM